MNTHQQQPAALTTHTSATLLLRLQDIEDHDAWTAFVETYAPVVFSWCRRFRLQDSDAADVTQDVLVKLMRSMQEFRYEPGKGRFRGWLKTVTANTIRDLSRSFEQRTRATGSKDTQALLNSLQAPNAIDALVTDLEARHQRELLEQAATAVQPRVKQHTWEAWKRTSMERVPASEVASQLGIAIGDVYVARSRINKMLTEEVQKLQQADN
ncbi:MAG: RNA polymerase sigma factor [Planctomycetaceae bacterium]